MRLDELRSDIAHSFDLIDETRRPAGQIQASLAGISVWMTSIALFAVDAANDNCSVPALPAISSVTSRSATRSATGVQ